MTYMLLLNCALKLVEEIILYYDARSKKHARHVLCRPAGIDSKRCHQFCNSLCTIMLGNTHAGCKSGGRDNVVSRVTYHRVDITGFKPLLWSWVLDLMYLFLLAPRLTQPPLKWVSALFPEGKVARTWD